MKLDVFKNKKNGQFIVFLKKKDLTILGIKDPEVIKLSKSNFITKVRKNG